MIETDIIELKEKVTSSVAKEIVAYLNTDGGTIYVGIKDDGKVIGVNNVDESMKQISDIITDQISPKCSKFVNQKQEILENKNIIKISVLRGNQLFYIKKYGLSENGCYVRIGTTCKSLSPNEIQERFINYLSIPEKQITDIKASRQNLSFQILKNYLITNNIFINENEFFNNFHLLDENGNFNYLAEILSDKNDISINVATFATTDKTSYLKREEFGGKCLLLAMEQAKNYVNSINRTYVDLSTTPRKEVKLFNTEAFEQAWINACVHNKWSESDHPGIYIYSDRIEIESFGGIPKVLTKKQFLNGKSEPVNKRLFDIFRTCGFAEESGHGVPLIVKVYGKSVFEFSKNYIDVTIPFKLKDETNQITSTKTTRKSPQEVRTEVVFLLKSNPYLSRADLAIALNVTEPSIRHHLETLKEKGIIQHIGPDKGGYWKVIK